jgi:hypothetical protein
VAAAATRSPSFSITDPCPQSKRCLLSAWRRLCTAAAALAPSQWVLLAVCTHARGYRRRGCRHRRKSSLKLSNLRRWQPLWRRHPLAHVPTAITTPWEGERAAAALQKLPNAERKAPRYPYGRAAYQNTSVTCSPLS